VAGERHEEQKMQEESPCGGRDKDELGFIMDSTGRESMACKISQLVMPPIPAAMTRPPREQTRPSYREPLTITTE